MQQLTDMEFCRLVDFVKGRYGINLSKKRTLVESRLFFNISQRGYSSYASYLRDVMNDPDGEECQHMINRLSTNYTFFFREPHCFEYLMRRVLPQYDKAGQDTLDLWCAACASGEEAYSLSMALARHIRPSGRQFKYRITASDINTEMLEFGEQGIYPIKALDSIPPEYRHFVSKDTDTIKMKEQIARPITWKKENLLECDQHGTKDIILCRNAMIYFSKKERGVLVQKLHEALKPGGYLFISATENIDLERKIFVHLEPSIYQRGQ